MSRKIKPAPQTHVKVKPLEWRQLYPEQNAWPKDWHGKGVLGTLYTVQQPYPDGEFYVLGKGFQSLGEAQDATQAHYEHHILSALVTGKYPLTTEPGYDNSFECVLSILRSDEGLHRQLGYLARAAVYRHAIDAIEESQARMADLEKSRQKVAMIAGHLHAKTVANSVGRTNQADILERLANAIEGECDGLAIDQNQAVAILSHVLGQDDAPPSPKTMAVSTLPSDERQSVEEGK